MYAAFQAFNDCIMFVKHCTDFTNDHLIYFTRDFYVRKTILGRKTNDRIFFYLCDGIKNEGNFL